MKDPAQHLLGGLNVAILIAHDSSLDQVDAARISLEELGVNVTLVGESRAAVRTLRTDGPPEMTRPSLPLSAADADAYDGVVVIASPHGGARLALNEEARAFLVRMDAEGKPIGAVSDGVLPVLSAGVGDAELSAPAHLLPTAQKAGVVATGDGLTVDANIVSAASEDGMALFLANLKHLLAKRRCATITPDNDMPSAVGEAS
jgi:putative intracellular protease/amidase